MKINRNNLILIFIVSIVLLAVSGCGKNKLKEGIVAEVKDRQITQEEFDKEFEMTKSMNAKQFGEDFLAQELGENLTVEDFLREQLLMSLIHEDILIEELNKLDILITEEDVDEALNTRYINQIGNEEKYEQYLNDMGITDGFLRRNIKRQLIYEKHREHFINKIDLSEDEVKEYFNENKDSFVKVRASHILVKTSQEGNEVLRNLKSGEKFSSLAATHSIDSQTAVKGGDLGYFTKGSMIDEYKDIEDVAFSLGESEVSGLIETDLGYHIVLVEDRLDSYDELKDEVIVILKNVKYNDELDKLIEESDVKIYMDSNNELEKENN